MTTEPKKKTLKKKSKLKKSTSEKRISLKKSPVFIAKPYKRMRDQVEGEKVLPPSKPVIGWREWVSLRNLSSRKIRAKIDTGAKTSSLHAEEFEIVRKGRKSIVYFDMFLDEKTNRTTRVCAPLIEERWVKDTGGRQTLRPVIPAEIRMGAYVWEIEVTLNNRSRMKHEFLLGKDAIKGRFWVDVASSYRIGKKLKKMTTRK